MHRNPQYPHTAGEITGRIHRLVGCCEESKLMCRQKFPVGMVLSCLISYKQQWAWLPAPSPPPATPLLKTWKMGLSAFAVSLGPLYWIAGVIRPESTFVVQCSFHDALFTWKTRTMHLLCLFIHTKLSIAGEWERGSGWGLGVGWNQRAIINPFSHTNH